MEQEAGARLQFNKPLTWKAGKPVAVAELLKRLEALSRELQTYEQDEVERESLFTVAVELASPQLLTHKDRGVKAYTGCCVVDIFRLCAPDAPYTSAQLKVGCCLLSAQHMLTIIRISLPFSFTPSFPPSQTRRAPTTASTSTCSDHWPRSSPSCSLVTFQALPKSSRFSSNNASTCWAVPPRATLAKS